MSLYPSRSTYVSSLNLQSLLSRSYDARGVYSRRTMSMGSAMASASSAPPRPVSQSSTCRYPEQALASTA
jgi:hypothetical protein